MKLILHIGAHKTGTSAIQAFLMRKNKKLEESGWNFITNRNQVNLSSLVSFQKKKNGTAVYTLNENYLMEVLELCRKNTHHKVISAEDLFFLSSKKEIAGFASGLKALFDEITVVVYLRDHVGMAMSNKAQGARTTQSSLVFGNNYQNVLPDLNKNVRTYLNYSDKLKTWRDCFSTDAFIVRKYEHSALDKNDSVVDFVNQTGLPLKPQSIKANKSMGSKLIQILHGLLYHGMNQHILWPLISMGILKDKDGVIQLPSKSQVIAFQAAFEKDRKSILAEYRINLEANVSKFPDKQVVEPIDAELLLENAVKIINTFDGMKVRPMDVDVIRDSALALKESDPEQALKLMKLAGRLRPGGPYIKKSITELESLLQQRISKQ